jgi:hypothetical protein
MAGINMPWKQEQKNERAKDQNKTKYPSLPALMLQHLSERKQGLTKR